VQQALAVPNPGGTALSPDNLKKYKAALDDTLSAVTKANNVPLRPQRFELARDTVRWRRVSYFAALILVSIASGLSAFGGLFALAGRVGPRRGGSSRILDRPKRCGVRRDRALAGQDFWGLFVLVCCALDRRRRPAPYRRGHRSCTLILELALERKPAAADLGSHARRLG